MGKKTKLTSSQIAQQAVMGFHETVKRKRANLSEEELRRYDLLESLDPNVSEVASDLMQAMRDRLREQRRLGIMDVGPNPQPH